MGLTLEEGKADMGPLLEGGDTKSHLDGQPSLLPAEASSTFQVGGMTCGACVETIEKMLREQPGIKEVSVALLAERAVVRYDPSQWTPEKIAEEIEDVGFEATPLAETAEDAVLLRVYGMTCGSCTSAVESALNALPGVLSAEVNLALEQCRVRFDKEKVGLRDIVECVEGSGFDAVLYDAADSTQLQSLSRVKETAEWRKALLFSASFAVPVFLISMVLPKWSFTRAILRWQPLSNLYLEDILCLALTIPVQFGVGKRFYISAWKALRHGSPTMDVLVVLGTTASFVYSSASMLFGVLCSEQCTKPATFFDTSTMLFTFVSFGRFLENTAKGKTSEALSKLIGLTPSTATIYSDGEAMTTERKVGSELIQRGDYVKVVPGEKIAADGVVIRGESTVDEGMITGEAAPVTKQPGSTVLGGTVNGLGSFDFLVTRAGKETSLAQIVRLVSEAQTSKAPIQAFADRAAGIFVPCVIGLGALTFTVWMIIAHLFSSSSLPKVFHEEGATKLMVCLKLCISVIVVACPCALGLSTPTAVMVGTGVGAQNGILIKGGGPLEASYSVDRIMFDKTGTLTEGKLSVSGVRWPEDDAKAEASPVIDVQSLDTPAVGGLRRRDILELVTAAETRSEHPLGRSLVEWCEAALGRPGASADGQAVTDATATDFQSVVGAGVRCRVTLPSTGSTHSVKVGNFSLIASDAAASLSKPLLAFRRAEESLGHTVVYASVDGSLALVVALADRLKPEARQCIEVLRAMGIRCGIMTGDSEATARAIAAELGIDNDDVHAGMSPNGKRSVIMRLRAEGEEDAAAGNNQNKSGRKGGGVAMVGDGINDSPALAAASVGIALSTGSEIAMEAADIVIMRSDLRDVAAALRLSRRIFRQIRLNFLWACGYNLIGIPLAMCGYLHPMMAAAAMAMSSVSVVASSLTLRWWKREEVGGHGAKSIVASAEFALEQAVAGLQALVRRARGNSADENAERAPGALNRVLAVLRPRRTASEEGYQSVPLEMA